MESRKLSLNDPGRRLRSLPQGKAWKPPAGRGVMSSRFRDSAEFEADDGACIRIVADVMHVDIEALRAPDVEFVGSEVHMLGERDGRHAPVTEARREVQAAEQAGNLPARRI